MAAQHPALKARRIPFEFPDDLDPDWIPHDPELSAMINGASLTMPYLEPFLIRTMREAIAHLDDDALRADGQGFIGQEGMHFRTHRRFNDLLKAKGYPELGEVESQMAASYERLGRRSLRSRMAYSAGFESMTLGVTYWMTVDRRRLFSQADTRVASMVLWHMVEETEHKRVAYDVYQALFGGSLSGYFARMIGVFHGSFDVMRFSMRAYRRILRKNGRWRSLRSRLRLARRLGWFVRFVGPYLLRAALPGHNPRTERDPDWVVAWLNGYDHHALPGVPLVDTHHPDIPPPFAKEHAA